MAADGFVYERTAIARHLATVGPTSPLTAAPLPHLQLLPCHKLKGSGDLGPASVRPNNGIDYTRSCVICVCGLQAACVVFQLCILINYCCVVQLVVMW